jgi:alkylation response protein AidB-like acyl-CoA dehydrogenase
MMRRKQVQQHGHFGSAAQTATKDAGRAPDNFTIVEGTSEIQRLIIGRWITGLDVR